jgi:tetratricopeptide (TPR) repeat protein
VPPRSFSHGTQSTEVRKNGDEYEVITPGLDGTNGPFVVDRVIGNNPLVQYLVPFPGGRWQTLEASYDPRSNEWFNVYGAEDRKPGEWGHWTGRGMNWNTMCAVCHNTRLRKNYDPDTDTFHTTMAEMTVGCEACHGPMKDHVEWVKLHGTNVADPTIKPLSREQMFDTCASCHSRRMELTGDFVPGDRYYDHYQLATVDETDTWYPDGQNWDEDYEVTALLGSRMHLKNVRCVDCHDFHSAKVRMPDNWMCLTCHAVGMTNAIPIDPLKHSFHSETNSGHLCTGCHMPQTAYMQRHWRHDHGFTIPDPLLTKQFGIPNACNRCHKDKTTEWSIEYVEKWYGAKMDRPYRRRAQTVATAKQGDASAVPGLIAMLSGDEIPYWRAVAARMLARWSHEPHVTDALLSELENTNALVRVNILHSLAPLVEQGSDRVRQVMFKSLEDPVRGVRYQAANALRADLPTNSLAYSEFQHAMRHNADQPAGQMMIGAHALARGDTQAALKSYRRAVEYDAYSPAIRHELAVVLSMAGQPAEAVKQLQEACRLAPTDAEFRYKLALALNELGRLSETAQALEEAVRLNPQHARAWYNLGLARNSLGDGPGGVEALVRAENLEPSDPRIPYAAATILARMGDLPGAREAATRALRINPNYGEARALLNQLSGGR